MKPKLAKIQEERMVKQRKVPNFSKKRISQAKSGREARTEVSMPLRTGVPISAKAARTRWWAEPLECAKECARCTT
eukprot:10943-Rhodomonas_salina.1